MDKRKSYHLPIIEVENLDLSDIIATSPPEEGDDNLDLDMGEWDTEM